MKTTPENFERMANLPTTTRDGLVTMRARALAGKREDLVAIADRVLRERFRLQAGKERSQRQGRTPTEVRDVLIDAQALQRGKTPTRG